MATQVIDRDAIDRIVRAVRPLLPSGFYGRIELNFWDDGVPNVNVVQSFKAEPGDAWVRPIERRAR